MQLFIQSYGAKVAVRNGIFDITTVEGKQYQKHEYAPCELKSLWIQKGCSITSDAIHLAFENGIDILILDRFGKPSGRFLPIVPNSIITIQRAQLLAANQPLGLALVKGWIVQKMRNQAALLTQCIGHHRSKNKKNPQITEQIDRILVYSDRVMQLEATCIAEVADTLRGIEGNAGKAYFNGLTQILPERYDFKKRTYQKSEDFFNTCLNYGYAILYSKVETALVKAGLNPYIGLMHADGSLQRSLVYDFVEPYRCWVDEIVIHLVASKKMGSSLFEIQENDVLWLSSEGKRLLADALVEMFQIKETYLGSHQVSRERLLLLMAQNFATQLMENQRIEEAVEPILLDEFSFSQS